MIVEDDFLIGLSLTELLESAGVTVIGPIGWRDEALSFVAAHHAEFDCALLDVDLHGEASYPIADALLEHDIRFVFTTGYAETAVKAGYRKYPRCEKPIQEQAILAALATL